MIQKNQTFSYLKRKRIKKIQNRCRMIIALPFWIFTNRVCFLNEDFLFNNKKNYNPKPRKRKSQY